MVKVVTPVGVLLRFFRDPLDRERLLVFHHDGVAGNFLNQRRRDHRYPFTVADDDVARHHQHPCAGNRHVDINR